MELDKHRRQLHRIKNIVLIWAGFLALILILSFFPELHQTIIGRLLLPIAIIVGFIIVGLATYIYYSSKFELEKLPLDNFEYFNEFLLNNNIGSYTEPFESFQADFRQFKKLLSAERGVLYIVRESKLTPVAAFGNNISKISNITFGKPPDIFSFELGCFHTVDKVLQGELKWQPRYMYRLETPQGTKAIAFFSEVDLSEDIEDFQHKLVRILFSRIAFGIDYTAAKHSFQALKKKFELSVSENLNLKKELKRKVFEIHTLFKESSSLYTIFNEDKLLNTFLLMIMGQLGLRKAVILGKSKNSNVFEVRYARGISRSTAEDLKIDADGSLASRLDAISHPITIKELEESLIDGGDKKFLKKLESLGFKAFSKLLVQGEDYGYLLLGEKLNGLEYIQTDMKLLTILINILTSALQNIHNYRIIEELSFTDSITGLYNYRYFYKRLNEEIFRARRHNRRLALAIFDIDDFKLYNDSFGHQAGDSVLRELGSYLRKFVRNIDIVSRYGGEEFCVIMQEIEVDQVRVFIERLRRGIELHKFKNEFTEESQRVNVSVGAAMYPQDAKNADELIYCADMAMLKAKSDGKNRAYLYSDLKLPSPKNTKKFARDS